MFQEGLTQVEHKKRRGKDSYRQLQDFFYKYISENNFNLERGKSKRTKHIDTETLKQITNFDNINMN